MKERRTEELDPLVRPPGATAAPGKRARTEGISPRQDQTPHVGAVPALLPCAPATQADDPFGLHLPVQRLGDAAVPADRIHAAAAHGVAGPGSSLPHRERIQAAFGPDHDVSHVTAHIGGRAAEASSAMGAEAFATGNQVAFAGPPDLRTAAHEAAHVIQQRAGVQLLGGVGQAGDAYEQHADAVADAVVEGRSAARLLDRMAGAGGGGGGGNAVGVQALGGNLDHARTLPRFGGARDFRAELARRDAPGGRPGQDAAVERDENHNNRDKVAFEEALAQALRASGDLFAAPVAAVSQRLLAYMNARAHQLATDVETQLGALTPTNTTFGRLLPDVAAVSAREYGAALRAVLAGGGPVFSQLQAHAKFMDSVYAADHQHMVDDARSRAQALLTEGGLGAATSPERFKDRETRIPLGIGGDVGYEDAHDHARIRPGQRGAMTDGAVPTERGGIGRVPALDVDQPGPFVRGTDEWTAREQAAFVQDARLVLDMPVSGTGTSGTTAELINCATLFGLGGADRHAYVMAALAYFLAGGAHTFHEVMTIARQIGIPYVPGQYQGVFPDAFTASAAYRALAERFPQYLQRDAVPAVAARAADGPHLQGFAIDRLRLGEDEAAWPAEIAAFLAPRLGVAPEELVVVPNHDGRSGDLVFMVHRDAAPGFVFKLFSDARGGDNEALMLEELRRRGVAAPRQHGMARVEVTAEDGPKTYGGLLMDLVRGTTVNQLLLARGRAREQRAGLPAEGPEAAEFDVQLAANLRALRGVVEDTARQMVQLHLGEARAKFNEREQANPNLAGGKAHYKAAEKVGEVGLNHQVEDYRGKLAQLAPTPPLFTAEEREAALAAFADRVDRFNAVQLPRAPVHGDANPGNVMAVEGGGAALIDVATMDIHLDEEWRGKGVGAADSGRFVQSLMLIHPAGLTRDEHAELAAAFRTIYMPERFGAAEQARFAQLDARKAGGERLAGPDFEDWNALRFAGAPHQVAQDQRHAGAHQTGEVLFAIGITVVALRGALDDHQHADDGIEREAAARKAIHIKRELLRLLGVG